MYESSTDGRGSVGQLHVFALMKDLYPKYTVVWEQPIRSLGLRYDIFVKELGIAVEVDGDQHYEVNSFFHKDPASIKKSYKADLNKDYFSEINGIKLIRFRYKESKQLTIEGLRDRIENTPYPDGVYTFSCLS